MPTSYECEFLDGLVELTDERRKHIEANHPDLLPGHEAELRLTVAAPDLVGHQRPMRNELALIRWFDSVRGGRYVAAVVVSDPPSADGTIRHWIVTAHVARRLGAWGVLWERPSEER